MNVWGRNNLLRITGSFQDINGTPADPSLVTLLIQPPAPTVEETHTTPAVVRDSLGAFHYDRLLDVSGVWSYQWVATGSLIAATEQQFLVPALHT